MNFVSRVSIGFALPWILFAASSHAATFSDSTGDATLNSAGGTADMVSMEVTETASDVVLALRVNGNIGTTDWANFMVGIATTKSTGSTTNNAWGRPIRMNVVTNGVTNGMTHWIGSWVSGGGGSQLWAFGTTNWQGPAALAGFSFSPGVQSTISYTISKTSLGVTTGDILYFDAYSSGSGGGDGALDSLANPATSISAWNQAYTSSNTNNTVQSYTLSFNVSDSDGDGLPDVWETEKLGNLTGGATDDPDSDNLTNAQEYASGTHPNDPDSDDDGLTDGVESNSGAFGSATNTGTNPLDADSDNDGTNDGAEVVAGTNPTKFNYSQITVAGGFQGWSPTPTNNPSNIMTRVTGDEFGWELKFRMSSATSYAGKFTTGSWSQNWGTSSTPGVAQAGGFGNDIPFNVTSTGIWRFYFNTDTLAFSFARVAAPATYGEWAAQYGLAADSGTENADTDSLTNAEEFSANTDPTVGDTDGDGLFDDEEVSGAYANLRLGSPVITNPMTRDSDGDGLPDKWELDYYLDPTDDGIALTYTSYVDSAFGLTITSNPNGAASNPDGDALTNLQEYSGSKDPIVAEGDTVSSYPKVVVAGGFVQTKPDGSWDEVGNPGNTMQLVSNFTWNLVVYLSAIPAFAEFKFTTGSWSTNFGDNIPQGGVADGIGDANGANINALPVFIAPGYYMITFNDFSKAYTIAPLAAADADNDGLPDEWEVFYGGYLNPKLTNLVPGTIYIPGGTQTAAQAFSAGANPVVDTVAPTISLSAGVEKVAWVAVGTTVVLADSDVTASDAITTSPAVTFDPLTVDTTVSGLVPVTYTATDAAGNATTLTRVIAVGDAEPGWCKLHYPKDASISTVGSTSVYGRIYVAGATPGAGQAPNISAELGVNPSNTDPSTWGASAWRTATFNVGFTQGDDEYFASVNGAELGVGTYFHAFRFKIGSGAWVYAGINAAGTDGGPWDATNGSGTLTVTQAVTREVAFAVDMGVQIFKGAFDPATNGVELRAGFNNFTGGASVLSREGTSTIYSGTFTVEGAEGSTNNYKFFSTGTNAVGYEAGSDRQTVLTAPGVSLNTGTNFFGGLSESRKITFRVDMSTQTAKGNFNLSGNTVSVAGSFNGWTAPVLLSPQGSGVYGAEVTVDGPLNALEYKFVNGANYEGSVSNRTITAVLPNLQASALDPVLFNNDDGIGPVITLTGDSPINLNVGDLFTDPGATASDAIDGAVTVNTTGSVNTAVANTYTLTYTAIDAAGNAAAPVTRTVVVAPSAGSTFAGAYSGKDLTNQAANGLTYLVNYAFGGSDTSDPKLPALDTSDPANLTLVAYVRTNNTVGTLGVVAEKADALTDWDTNNPISGTPALDQTGAPTGTQKQIFSTPKSGNRQFLRLRTTLAP